MKGNARPAQPYLARDVVGVLAAIEEEKHSALISATQGSNTCCWS